jgi:uncharacterized membrane protein YbhN (UPF0104 family)
MQVKSAMAVTCASNALSVTVPVAGAGLGAAFSFRQFHGWGIRAGTVGWALTVSGVMSALSFALLMTIGAVVSGDSAAIVLGLSGAAVTVLPMLALLVAVRIPAARRAVVRVVTRVIALWNRLFRHGGPADVTKIEVLLDQVGDVQATPRLYALAFFLSLRNWIADLVCLACAIKAAGAPVPWHGLILAYRVAASARSAGMAPGGLGVVEVTLSAALVAAGLPARRAVSVVRSTA